jgi:hypothetical protein
MKKVINLLGAVLITGSVSAQWTYKVSDNGFDEPYKIAYTPENNSASLYLFKIDTSVVFSVNGGYYCDDAPTVDVVFVVNGVDKKFSVEGYKGSSSDVIYISWNLEEDPLFLEAFKTASTVRIRINESYCTTEIYTFKMTSSKAAYDFMIK